MAELVVYGICPTSTTRFDEDANKCAGVLTVATANVAAVHAIAKQRGATDSTLDDSAAAVGEYAKVCDPKGPTVSIVDCLAAAEAIEVNGTVYVKTLRAKLDAVK